MPEFSTFAADALAKLGPTWVNAIRNAPIPALDAGSRVAEIVSLLEADPTAQWNEITEHSHKLCLSGLWLFAGDLDRSHDLSQDLASPEGSFWHGIMHRREGDFGNAKYWFRRVGDHPVFEQIKIIAGDDYGEPSDFVDQCSKVDREEPSEVDRSKQAAWLEWQALMVHCIGL